MSDPDRCFTRGIPSIVPHRMLVRRFVALVTLGCGGWVQALALACPMEMPAHPSADAAAHAAHAPDARMAASGPAASAGEEPPPHSAPNCMLMTGCGAGQIAPRLAGTAVDVPTSSSRTLLETTRCTTTFPTHEPPPPRLSV